MAPYQMNRPVNAFTCRLSLSCYTSQLFEECNFKMVPKSPQTQTNDLEKTTTICMVSQPRKKNHRLEHLHFSSELWITDGHNPTHKIRHFLLDIGSKPVTLYYLSTHVSFFPKTNHKSCYKINIFLTLETYKLNDCPCEFKII